MAHHKRRKNKNSRAGCLMCEPHKMNGAKKKDPPKVRRQQPRYSEDLNPAPSKEDDPHAYYLWYCTMFGGP